MSNAIAIINSMLRRLGPQDEKERSTALALSTPALVFYGFRITTYDDVTFDPFSDDTLLMLPESGTKEEEPKTKGRKTQRILDLAAQDEWCERINVFERRAGLLVAAMRSTAFLDGTPIDDLDVFGRLDEGAAWKSDLVAFAEAAQCNRGRLGWFFIAEDSNKQVLSVKLLLDEKPGGWI